CGRLEAEPLDDPGIPRRIVEQGPNRLLLIPPATAPPRPFQRPRERALLAHLEIDFDAFNPTRRPAAEAAAAKRLGVGSNCRRGNPGTGLPAARARCGTYGICPSAVCSASPPSACPPGRTVRRQ